MGNTLKGVQHFGVTVRRGGRSRRFYSRVLRFPFLAETVNRGERCDMMYRIREAVNHVAWYQIGDGGMETFYLPRHPSAPGDVSNIRKPGYRYMAFYADGIDDYAARLVGEGLDVAWAHSADGRCFRVQDPNGIHIVFFDSGRGARVGHVSAVKEIGLVVADPEGYEDFFRVIGLEKKSEDADFLKGLFGLAAPAPLYGNVRLVCLPGAAKPIPERCFPADTAQPASRFQDVGIKHIAYYVDDAEAFYSNCRAKGVYFLFEPVKVKGGSKITYFLDPEGNTFEAMEVNAAARKAGEAAGKARRFQLDVNDYVKGIFDNV